MKRYICAIDQGTTGTTVIFFDKNGSVAGQAYSEFTQRYPKPGWVEHDPEEIWAVTSEVISKAMENGGIKPSQIAGIGITNQRETTVLWDKTSGKPVHNAIVWQCRRTADMCKSLKEKGFDGFFQQKTGLVIDAYFSATKVAWLLENVTGIKEKAEKGDLCFGTIDSWLIYKLTGNHFTDYSNASRTMMFNIRELKWDEEILNLLEIPYSILPEVKPSKSIFGYTKKDSPFGEGIAVAGDAGDQQAALFGQGCFEPGTIKNTYGTGCFILLNTGKEAIFSKNGLLTTIACDENGLPAYALEGSIFIAGAGVQWLRDSLKIISSASETEAIALSIPDTKGVYVVPAFVGLGAPYWDMYARGAVLGLTRGAGRAEIVRATLEAIAYQTRDVIEVMQADSGLKINSLKVDGGAVVNNFLMQFQADILGIEVERPAVIASTARGAAFLAGLGVGFWKNALELKETIALDRKFLPLMSNEERELKYKGWKEAVERVRTK